MMEKSHYQMSESFLLAALLASVGGFLDAYSYVCRDHVFANAQTGNIVKLGMSIAQGDVLQAIKYFILIIAFGCGVFLTMLLRKTYAEKKWHWRQIVLIIEMMIVVLVSIIPIGPYNVIVHIMISFLCAMQAECFKKVLGSPFSSTMCTGNLRSSVENLYQAIVQKNQNAFTKSIHYLLIICFFILGVIAGVWLTYVFDKDAILFCLAPIMCSLLAMFEIRCFYSHNKVK